MKTSFFAVGSEEDYRQVFIRKWRKYSIALSGPFKGTRLYHEGFHLRKMLELSLAGSLPILSQLGELRQISSAFRNEST